MYVIPYENESIDSLISRFNKLVNDSGLMSELKKRESYEKPSSKRRKKVVNKIRKSRAHSERRNRR